MVVMNFEEAMYVAVEKWNKENEIKAEYSRYNGGWLKTVRGVDESKKGGFSIEGEFVKGGDFDENYVAGLYLDCSKDGSRKNQQWHYHLLKITEKGEVEIVEVLRDAGRNFAPHFWKFIYEELENANGVESDVIDVAGLRKEISNLQEKVNKLLADNERAQNEALQWKKEAKKLTVTLENVEAFIASKSSYVVSSKDIEGDYEALAIVESLDEAFDIIKNDSAGYSKYYCVEQNLTGNKVFYEVKDSKTNSQGVFDYYSEVRDLDDGYKLCLRDRTVNSVFTVD